MKEVIMGQIRINHGEYTPDGGTWLSNTKSLVIGSFLL